MPSPAPRQLHGSAGEGINFMLVMSLNHLHVHIVTQGFGRRFNQAMERFTPTLMFGETKIAVR